MDLRDVKIKEIIDIINSSKKPFMFFDTDTDGSCSFLQLRKAFSQLKEGFPLSKDDESQDRAFTFLNDSSYDIFIFFDTPYVRKDLFEAACGRKVIWVDHHIDKLMKTYSMEFSNLVIFNPLFYNENDHRCSSFWAYEISGRLKENLFYVSLASVADFYLLDILRDFYAFDKSSFNVLFKLTDEKREELFSFLEIYSYNDVSLAERAAKWVQFLTYDAKLIIFKNFFDLLYKLEKEDEAMKIVKMIEKMSPVEFKAEITDGKSGFFEEFSSIMKEYRKVYAKTKKLEDSELIFFEHKNTSISFNRQISEELAYRFSNYAVIVSCHMKDGKEIVSCSFRGNGYDVNSLVQKCIAGLDAKGGGHKFAAGAIVKKKDFDVFKQRLFAEFDRI